MKLKKIAAVVVALVALVLVGCKQENDPETENVVFYSYILPVQSEDGIVGAWESTWKEKFEIAPNSFKNSYFDFEENTEKATYEGGTTYIRKTSTTSGYLYFKYTKALKLLDAEPWYEYSESALDVGKWYCVAFKNLKANSVYLSGAYKATGKTSTETLEEAVKEFTIDNGYFNTYSECTKSE